MVILSNCVIAVGGKVSVTTRSTLKKCNFLQRKMLMKLNVITDQYLSCSRGIFNTLYEDYSYFN